MGVCWLDVLRRSRSTVKTELHRAFFILSPWAVAALLTAIRGEINTSGYALHACGITV